ncbi:MarR family winged helix-turn-helix transcriptional regulator [Rhodococcus opacus]|uniref:MarR family winged helix-turn-helix transcriptional regulator n=1 Tax=Rhodococcus opacus TaxID=37919 RepID=UPI001C480213|nr:helix-turn-helix domain-containing protein [Rhodococcus opacus]MBV6756181.1 MarR family transcriptional regulator [Rhodococcus opacus]
MNLSELRRLGRALSNAALASMHSAVDNSLTGTEIAVLDCIRVQSGLTVGEIARRSGFAQSRVSNVVADLADRGLLEIATDSADRRRSLVNGTPALMDLLANSTTLDAAPTLKAFFADVPDDEAARLITALEDAARIIEPQAAAYRKKTGGT